MYFAYHSSGWTSKNCVFSTGSTSIALALKAAFTNSALLMLLNGLNFPSLYHQNAHSWLNGFKYFAYHSPFSTSENCFVLGNLAVNQKALVSTLVTSSLLIFWSGLKLSSSLYHDIISTQAIFFIEVLNWCVFMSQKVFQQVVHSSFLNILSVLKTDSSSVFTSKSEIYNTLTLPDASVTVIVQFEYVQSDNSLNVILLSPLDAVVSVLEQLQP